MNKAQMEMAGHKAWSNIGPSNKLFPLSKKKKKETDLLH
jgi:hypothetical protein